MPEETKAFLTQVNLARYHGQPQGHYESFFQRANHPTRPLAFWIRYTLFSPKARPQRALGELWAIFFVGLNYYNPPGGTKHCLNTKIASCVVQIRDKALGTTETLETKSRAAFEILTDDRTHGVPISA